MDYLKFRFLNKRISSLKLFCMFEIAIFVNMWAVLVSVHAHKGFGTTIHEARRAVVNALEYGRAPFAKVVEFVQQGQSRDLTRTPLYQTMVVWQETRGLLQGKQCKMTGLQTASIECAGSLAVTEAAANKLEIELHLERVADRLEGGVSYNSGLFCIKTVCAFYMQGLTDGCVSRWRGSLVDWWHSARMHTKCLISHCKWHR